ncbi:TPA: protein phosphatase, partial [Haemophilus influenzae]
TDGLSDEMREKIWQKYPDDKYRLTVCRKMIEKQSFSDDLSVVCCHSIIE